MGCGLTKEKLKTEILVLQLEKAEIQEERERLIHQLKIINRDNNYSSHSDSVSPSNISSNSRKLSSGCGTNDTE